ncbi:MAG: hypothetical protein HPY59_19095 [Anaerolineae bacterium]|nr:hypothetical protein [Anaerolineae bacterium]
MAENLSQSWSAWFDGMTISGDACGGSLLTGEVRDQADLFGILLIVRDLGLTLVNVIRVDRNPKVVK